MPRFFDSQTLVVASHNPGKVLEIRNLLKDFVTHVISAQDLNLPEPEETEKTFTGNAQLKALAASRASGYVALADDSGLCVSALDGQPGIYSARWACASKDFDVAMKRVISDLQNRGATDRSAWFACALSLAWPDGHAETFEGRVTGQIVKERQGTQGFGYDPIFIPDGHDVTFGEMEPELKHGISHRASAFRQLVDACFRN